jgi:hypothetical protein
LGYPVKIIEIGTALDSEIYKIKWNISRTTDNHEPYQYMMLKHFDYIMNVTVGERIDMINGILEYQKGMVKWQPYGKLW